jgi:hypothetical protein
VGGRLVNKLILGGRSVNCRRIEYDRISSKSEERLKDDPRKRSPTFTKR